MGELEHVLVIKPIERMHSDASDASYGKKPYTFSTNVLDKVSHCISTYQHIWTDIRQASE